MIDATMAFLVVAGLGAGLMMLLSPVTLDRELLYQQAQDLAEVYSLKKFICSDTLAGTSLECCMGAGCGADYVVVKRPGFSLGLRTK